MTALTPRLIFAGDTHGSLAHLAEAPGDCTVIHVGDFELAEPLEEALPAGLDKRFWWIPGNHDFDRESYYDRLHSSALSDRNIHGRVLQLEGIRVAGLGGVFLGRVWPAPSAPLFPSRRDYMRSLPRQNKWRGGLPLKLRSAIWAAEVESLSRQRADVLVLHEAPESHRHGFRALGDLARAMGARTIVHGHHHVDYLAEIDGGVRVIGVGLRGLTALDGEVLKPGLVSRV